MVPFSSNSLHVEIRSSMPQRANPHEQQQPTFRLRRTVFTTRGKITYGAVVAQPLGAHSEQQSVTAPARPHIMQG